MARSRRLESGFQDELRDEIMELFPGCEIAKMEQKQGYPDMLILYGKTWAWLENKKSDREPYQPNQEYYIDRFNNMSISAMICPENKDYIIRSLIAHFDLFS